MKALTKTWTLTMTLAISLQASALDWIDHDVMDGKIEAAQMAHGPKSLLIQAIDTRTEVESMIADIVTIEDMVGTSQEDTDGLLKALGEKEFFATLARKEIDQEIRKMASKKANEAELSASAARIAELKKQVERLHQETKYLVK